MPDVEVWVFADEDGNLMPLRHGGWTRRYWADLKQAASRPPRRHSMTFGTSTVRGTPTGSGWLARWLSPNWASVWTRPEGDDGPLSPRGPDVDRAESSRIFEDAPDNVTPICRWAT